MADTVWGIDVGQCGLKALRCSMSDNGKRLVAHSFDFVEYPKILTQPDAEPDELIHDALEQFLSRNSVQGCKVAISVSGEACLARFIRLPPVEPKRIPDIIRYEAREQIPFLDDVIWDYQRLGTTSENENLAMETEIGLFAIKRDAVIRALQPFSRVGIEVDIVQIASLAIYNYVVFDRMPDLPPPEDYDSDDPPESTVIISMGTDTTDLVITNGFRVWQRSIPIGGNHFTRALTTDQKLTFSKAEHLKRNARTSEDPRAVFRAMQPIYADLVAELRRSIAYFSNIDRTAKIGPVIALGNAMKLHGLTLYLSKQLDLDIKTIDEFKLFDGPEVLGAPAFTENAGTFGVSYGLALQALGKSPLRTNLLPKEIVRDRLIKKKKPWAVAAAATLLLGCGISIGANAYCNESVDPANWGSAESTASSVINQSSELIKKKEAADNKYNELMQMGDRLVRNVEGRLTWLEMIHAVDSCLPKEVEGEAPPLDEQLSLRITNIEGQQVDDLAEWYKGICALNGKRAPKPATGDGTDAPASEPSDSGSSDGPPMAPPGPSGEGWVIRVEGFHYHNDTKNPTLIQGPEYVRNTLINNLNDPDFEVTLTGPNITEPKTVTLGELGIGFADIIMPGQAYQTEVPDARARSAEEVAAAGGVVEAGMIEVERFDFTVHFAWQPKTPTERAKIEAERLAAEKEAAEAETPEE